MKQPTRGDMGTTGLIIWSLVFTGAVALQCGGIFVLDREKEEITITSPGYPKKYPKFSLCQWTVISAINKKLGAEFLDFSVEDQNLCLYDKLLVDGGTCDFQSSIKLCGNTQPQPIESTGNMLCFRFLSDYVANGRGFKIKLKLLDDSYFSFSPEMHSVLNNGGRRPDISNIPCDVFPVLITDDAIITSRGLDSGQQYPPNITCRWLVYLDTFHVAIIKFTNMDIEDHASCDSDSIQIIQGDEAAPNFNKKFCGSQLPDSITINDPSLIMFKSDGIVQGQGFSAKIQFVLRNLSQGFLWSQGQDENFKSAEVNDLFTTTIAARSPTSPLSVLELPLQEAVNPAKDEFNVPYSNTAKSSLHENQPSSHSFSETAASANILSRANSIHSHENMHRTQSTINNTVMLLTSFGNGENVESTSDINYFGYQSNYDNTNIYSQSISAFTEFINNHENGSESITKNNKFMSEHITNSYFGLAASSIENLSDVANMISTSVVSENIRKNNSNSSFHTDGGNLHSMVGQFDSINICSQTFYNLTLARVVIQSPGFGTGDYPLYIRCDVVIAAEPNMRLKVSFTHMDLENSNDCNLDWLEISSRSNSIGKFCGSVARDFIADDRMIMLTFVSDPIVAKSGFQLQIDKIEDARIIRKSWEDTDKVAMCDSIFDIVAKDGFYVTSPGYPQSLYPLDTECDLKLFVISTFQKLKVLILDMDIEPHRTCTYDYLLIYEGVTTPTSMARMCGNQTGVAITLSGSTVQLHFFSDHFVARKGFKLKVSPYLDSESLTVTSTGLPTLRMDETSDVNVFTRTSGAYVNEITHLTHISTREPGTELTMQEVWSSTNVEVLESFIPTSEGSFLSPSKETSLLLLETLMHPMTTDYFVSGKTSSQFSFATHEMSASGNIPEILVSTKMGTTEAPEISSEGITEMITSKRTPEIYDMSGTKGTSKTHEMSNFKETTENDKVMTTRETVDSHEFTVVRETAESVFISTLLTSLIKNVSATSSDITGFTSTHSLTTPPGDIAETLLFTANQSISKSSSDITVFTSTHLSAHHERIVETSVYTGGESLSTESTFVPTVYSGLKVVGKSESESFLTATTEEKFTDSFQLTLSKLFHATPLTTTNQFEKVIISMATLVEEKSASEETFTAVSSVVLLTPSLVQWIQIQPSETLTTPEESITTQVSTSATLVEYKTAAASTVFASTSARILTSAVQTESFPLLLQSLTPLSSQSKDTSTMPTESLPLLLQSLTQLSPQSKDTSALITGTAFLSWKPSTQDSFQHETTSVVPTETALLSLKPPTETSSQLETTPTVPTETILLSLKPSTEHSSYLETTSVESTETIPSLQLASQIFSQLEVSKESLPSLWQLSTPIFFQAVPTSSLDQLTQTYFPSATPEKLSSQSQTLATANAENLTLSPPSTSPALESACSGVPSVLTERSGLIVSPGFLQHEDYPTGIMCNWIVEGGQGRNISIQFDNFTLEYHPTCSYDFLELYNVTRGSQILIGRYCGQQFPNTLTSSGDSLVVVFVSDRIGRYAGFLLTYTIYEVATYHPPCPDGRVRCKDHQLCIPKEWLCDAESDCPLGGDEEDCDDCGDDKFTCPEGSCLPLYHVCDGVSNCNYGEDEYECVKVNSDNVLQIRKEGFWFPVCASQWLLSDSQLQWACTAMGQGNQLSAQNVTALSPFYANLTTALRNTSSINSWQVSRGQVEIHISSECQDNKVIYLKCAATECGVESTHLPQPFVLGSSSSVDGQWPWTVALFSGADFKCGATLIFRQWLVSAGHCVINLVDSPQTTTARLGHVNIQSPDIVVIRIVEVIVHPQNNYIYENDISLLRLETAVEINNNQRPVCLDSLVRDWVPNTPCYVAGWGVTDKSKISNPQATPILHHAKISIWEQSKCQQTYPGKIKQSMLCAGYQFGEMDACKGDSGGPLMCATQFHKWQLVGVVSWGEGCGEIGKPGVYTRVDSYLDWIKSTTDERVNYGVSCDFEYPNICGYTSQSDSEFLWTRRMGGVSRPYTDNTFKNASGHYMYTYVPYGVKFRTTMLTSPLVGQAQTGYCVQASVFIQDCSKCKFEVRVIDVFGNLSQTLLQVMSEVTTNWMRFELDLPLDTQKINFLSTSGRYSNGGIGLDDVILAEGLCGSSKLLNCRFSHIYENANPLCAYQQDTTDDFDWAVASDSEEEGTTDRSEDDVFIRALSNGYPGDRARIISPAVKTSISMCLLFRIRISSANAGILTVCRKLYFNENPTMDCNIWSASASDFKLHTWEDVKVGVSALDIEFSVVFQAAKGEGVGYIDVDKIYKIDGDCI